MLLFLAGLVFIQYFQGRSDWDGAFGTAQQIPFLLTYGFLFVLYFLLNSPKWKEREINLLSYASVAFRFALLFSLPNYSDDFYRFVWDGHLAMDGYGLLEKTPMELTQLIQGPNSIYAEVYPHLNSQQYFTVYPPALQMVFRFAAWIAGESLLGMVVVMKCFLLLTEIGSIVLMGKLLKQFKKPFHWVLVYALNPLVMLEVVGNVHFEGFMFFFSLLALWILVRWAGKWTYLAAAIPIALAITAKLLPVLFFPFLIRRLGLGRAILLGLTSGILTLGLFALLFDLENFANYGESIRLYFQAFEFNANIYYIGRWLLGPEGYWVNRILPWISLGLILGLAIRKREKSWSSLPLMMLAALSVYQILQPVIHPWYITPLIGFAALSRYRFPVVWSVFLPLTYLTYTNPDYQEPSWVLWIEYGVLFIYLFFEIQFDAGAKTLEDWVREKPFLKAYLRRSIPARMNIKLDRIAAFLKSGDRVLDIGTGNGGLCRELRGRGFEVQPVDVKNISFFDDVQPLIYDGRKLPFEEGAFPVTMLITVLHHIPDPEAVLREAIRVSGGKIIVMEDIYKNPVQKYLTYFTDSLVNLEFAGHPHTNKDDEGWRQVFQESGLKLVARKEFRTLLFFRQVIYVLEK